MRAGAVAAEQRIVLAMAQLARLLRKQAEALGEVAVGERSGSGGVRRAGDSACQVWAALLSKKPCRGFIDPDLRALLPRTARCLSGCPPLEAAACRPGLSVLALLLLAPCRPRPRAGAARPCFGMARTSFANPSRPGGRFLSPQPLPFLAGLAAAALLARRALRRATGCSHARLRGALLLRAARRARRSPGGSCAARAPHVMLWALFGTAAAMLPGQIFMINDSIFQMHLFWPVFLAALLPLRRGRCGLSERFRFFSSRTRWASGCAFARRPRLPQASGRGVLPTNGARIKAHAEG